MIFDTNVVLDCYGFDDPFGQQLVEQIKCGRLTLLTRPDLRLELVRVLDYVHLPFDATKRSQALAAYDAQAQPMTLPGPGWTPARLPVCRDPDDQKFLEAARDACADVLLTKDKALLELARNRARPTSFRILTPLAFLSSGSAGRADA